MKIELFVWGLVAMLLQPEMAAAQPSAADTSQTALASLRQRYSAAQGYGQRLYNGPEYVNYVRRYIKGHQFFETDEHRPATIEYDGATYTGIPLRYDLIRGQAVLKAPIGALDLHLVNEHLTRFTLAGHTFVRLVATPGDGLPSPTGFYDQLLAGPTPVLVARHKEILERNTADGRSGEMLEKNEVFISKSDHYYKINKARSVLALFPEHKAALRKYSKANNLKFGARYRESSTVALVRYQHTLVPVGQ